jgi:hypothetical protein
VPAGGPSWAEVTTAISTALLVVISGFAFWVGLLSGGRYRPIKVTSTIRDGRLPDDRWMPVPEDMNASSIRLASVNVYNKSDRPQVVYLLPERTELRKDGISLHALPLRELELGPGAAATWQVGFGPADWAPADDDYRMTLKVTTGGAKSVTWRRARRVEALAYGFSGVGP